ncbi:hypothetical protein [Stenotrophomonas maltophilia]|uniref:hypothetical protein n=1 Tax=Stenotrophomonas maltophilia TaxID=40324 RepID=UPI001140C5D6|nr:hypothetical protein [Stenotrophomonas maltophilia]
MYHVVDTRNDDALVQQAVISFDVPEVSLGPSIEASNGKSYRGTSDFYLSHSVPGNMFTGVMNIKSGQVDLFPLAPDRLDMIDTSWGQKAYSGPIHDGSQRLIEHPGQGGSGVVSHMQLVAKLADKNPDNYVGFTMLDVRSLRRSGAEWNIVNDAVSMLYGASRSLNSRHVKLIDEIPNNRDSNAEAFNHSKGSIGYHLPVEVKRHILTGIAEKLGSDHTWTAAIRSEMDREELSPNAYEIALAKKAAAISAPRLYI